MQNRALDRHLVADRASLGRVQLEKHPLLFRDQLPQFSSRELVAIRVLFVNGLDALRLRGAQMKALESGKPLLSPRAHPRIHRARYNLTHQRVEE